MSGIGIDFGTSNTSAAVLRDGVMKFFALDNGQSQMPSALYVQRKQFAVKPVSEAEVQKRLTEARRDTSLTPVMRQNLEAAVRAALRSEAERKAQEQAAYQTIVEALKRKAHSIVGHEAIAAYENDPLGGFFVRSPKVFLGSSLPGEYLEMFELVIAAMLSRATKAAEAQGLQAEHAVLGRPIRYHGARGEAGNRQALKIMEMSARSAGIRHVEFMFEPLAAALEYERLLACDELVLVVDIGGGTTDCSLVKVGPSYRKKTDRSADLVSYCGDRIGGMDMDSELAWHALMPYFGKDTGVPHHLIRGAVLTQDIPRQIEFYSSAGAYSLEAMIHAAKPEISALLDRLRTVQKERLTHRLVHSAELAKIALSDQEVVGVDLKFIEPGLTIQVSREQLGRAIERENTKIVALIKGTMSGARRPDKVFLTGGSAISPVVRKAIYLALGQDTEIITGDMFGSVTAGLAVHAQRVFG